MRVFVSKYGTEQSSEVHSDVINAIINDGHKVGPRGRTTLELNNICMTFNQAVRPSTWPGRKLNPFFLLAEALWILAGTNQTALLSCHMKAVEKYYDRGETFGAYGPRFIDQLNGVVKTLTEDPDSRQAVITLWRPDLYSISGFRKETRDVPCTVMMHFRRVRYINGMFGPINMTVYMRSNDMYKGFPYDVFNFGVMHTVVAARLNAATGDVEHIVGSAHLYEEDLIHAIRRQSPMQFVGGINTGQIEQFRDFNLDASQKVLENLVAMARKRDEPCFPELIPTGIEVLDDWCRVLADRLDLGSRPPVPPRMKWFGRLLDDYCVESPR